MQLQQQCSHNPNIHKRAQECPNFSSTCLQMGPQILSDAISEVEKLQAAQQLTATLLPSSMVNVMSSEDD